MKRFFFLIIVWLCFLKTNAQTCNYTENFPTSSGYICLEDELIFTSSLNTFVIGIISAQKTVRIVPVGNNSITIGTNHNCRNCLGDGNGTGVIKTGGSGGGIPTTGRFAPAQQRIEESFLIEENPAVDILTFTIKQGLIRAYKIYDTTGKEIIVRNISPINKASVSVSSLLKGKYLLKVETTGDKIYTKQFIKQ